MTEPDHEDDEKRTDDQMETTVDARDPEADGELPDFDNFQGGPDAADDDDEGGD